jgi:cytochrome P450
VPLSTPITLSDGKITDHIVIPAGQKTAVPIFVVNRMKSLWGEDAWDFKPERWLNNGQGIPASAKDVQGHRHLITFVNGPRTCLGKHFALAEFKVRPHG